MPELPEVETVRRGLQPVMEGQTILRAELRRPDLRWPFPENMTTRLEGTHIIRLRRRSKYILADLSSNETLIVHLGMSGRIMVAKRDATVTADVFLHRHDLAGKHDHVLLGLSGATDVVFNDPRRFGAMDLAATDGLETHRLLAGIGPEPLGNMFNETYLRSALSGRNMPIKSALLDQRLVAGLGNIYVCEALFRAGIHPARKAKAISAKRIARLVPVIREVLQEAILAGGSSLRDYRRIDGDLGYFQHRFRVYGREGAPCVTGDCAGRVARLVQSGRSSFYCPRCQR